MEDYRNLKKNEIYLWEMKNGEKFLARLVEFLDDSKISVDLEISGDDRRESEYYIIHPDKARLASKVPQMSFAQFDIHTIGDTFKFTMRPRQALFPNAAMNYQTFVGRVVGTAGDTEVVSVEIDLDDEKQERVEIAVERIAFIEPVEEEEEKKEEDGYDAKSADRPRNSLSSLPLKSIWMTRGTKRQGMSITTKTTKHPAAAVGRERSAT
jgi:hypothetical protein